MSINDPHEIMTCEVCGNDRIMSVLDLGRHPMCDDLVSIGEDRICSEYPIEILFCETCNTGHQRFQVPKEDLFPATYHYRSRFTADVLGGMKGLVESCIQRLGSLANKLVIDVGCNDGSLLNFFRDQGARTIGIEPTDAYLDAQDNGHVTYNRFLSEELAGEIIATHGKPDVITFTNVFAHIENLPGVLRSLKTLMSRTTYVVIENHYLGSVLHGHQFDTFYHEHPRTYSYCSFVQMAKTLGTHLVAVEFPSRYGGNIRVLLGNAAGVNLTNAVDLVELEQRERSFLDKFVLLKNNVERWQKVKRKFVLEQHRKYGKLRAKAFPGRAAILIKLLDLDESIISAVYEKPGSLKIGHYLPGTRIPIFSDDELFASTDNTLPILNLAWHIPNEIRSYLLEHAYSGEVFDILEASDFS